jgi:uncharacterized membrane protein YcaP (DUF421 family)
MLSAPKANLFEAEMFHALRRLCVDQGQATNSVFARYRPAAFWEDPLETVVPFDWERILLGEHSAVFLLEIVCRVIVIWLWTASLLRWIGGRSIAQLSIVEFLLVIALGSAVGDSMFYPDVPLFHAMVVILVVVSLDKVVDAALRRWSKAKSLIDGRPVEVMRDGVILCDGLNARKISTLELMELLRLEGIENLGAVRRAYLEPSGGLSLFLFDEPRLGLSIVPPVELVESQQTGADSKPCCRNCGQIGASDLDDCSQCGDKDWTSAKSFTNIRDAA